MTPRRHQGCRTSTRHSHCLLFLPVYYHYISRHKRRLVLLHRLCESLELLLRQ
jgi:hypothetical protein